MKNNLEQKLLIMLLLLTGVLSMFMYSGIQNLNMGLNYGKDTTVIIETKKPNTLIQYLEDNITRFHDTEIRALSNTRVYFKTSGIVSIKDFTTQLKDNVPDAYVSLSGSFGTNTSVTNTESFVKLSLMALMILVFIYLYYQYNFVGWILSLILLIPITISFHLLNFVGLAFTTGLWMFLILLLSSYLLLLTNYINYHHSFIVMDILTQKYKLKKVCLSTSYLTFLIGLLGLGFLYLLGNPFLSVGTFGVAFSGTLLIIIGLIYYFTNQNMDIFQESKSDYTFLEIDAKHYRVQKGLTDGVFNIYSRLSGLIFLLLLLILAITRPPLNFDASYSDQRLLVMSDSSSQNYIELKAELMRQNIDQYQISYGISEQEETWIYFSEEANLELIENAGKTFSGRVSDNNTTIRTYVFNLPGNTYPLFDYKVLIMLALFLVLNIMALYRNKNKEELGYSLLVLGSSMLMYILLSYLGRVRIGNTFGIGLILIPFLVTCHFLFTNNEDYRRTLVKTISLFGSIYGIIAVPMLVITPSTSTFNLVFIIGIVFLAVVMASYLMYGVFFRKRG